MNSWSPARASVPRRASAKPTASKPEDKARSRIASRIGSVMSWAQPLLGSASPAIGCHARIGQPQPRGRLAGLVEDVDRDATARVPIAADPQPARGQCRDEPPGDRQRAVFVERRMIAEGAEVELQRLALEDRSLGHVIDYEMGEIGLAGHRTERSEFRAGET